MKKPAKIKVKIFKETNQIIQIVFKCIPQEEKEKCISLHKLQIPTSLPPKMISLLDDDARLELLFDSQTPSTCHWYFHSFSPFPKS